MTAERDGLGLSGHLARAFIRSPITPLLLIASLVAGAIALWLLPREEEPQISVPMVDIFVEANGLRAEDAVELVTEPLETIVKGIKEVEHVYSQTRDDRVVVTARFFVGTSEDDAILRVHERIRANFDRIPFGIPEPLIVKRGINDVPILTLTFHPRPDLPADRLSAWTDNALYRIAEETLNELVRAADVGLAFIVGGRPDQIRIEPDPERMALYGVTLEQLVDKVRNANRQFLMGRLRERDRSIEVLGGQTLRGVPDIGLLLVTTRDGRPVYVQDVADIVVGTKETLSRVWQLLPDGRGGLVRLPAVTVAIAKREGANAVVVAEELLQRLEGLRGRLIPEDVEVAVTRNYGETAAEKADELLFHLLLATVSIVVIVALAIGLREAWVVLWTIPVTILLTFFASWVLGYTINRVSLFALIFAIGILVDDAIVFIENIARHWRMEPRGDLVQLAVRAVAEVGNPTIVATLTVVAALLPMLFVSGLMGPYMEPIPVNASAAMLFSFFVAVIVAPWMRVKLGRGHASQGGGSSAEGIDAVGRFYLRVAPPFYRTRLRALLLLLAVGTATLGSFLLFWTRDVTVKLLPFDNKSELQVVVDLREGSTLEATERTLEALARAVADLPELASLQLYAGTAAPFNFNGLVRHYYIRNSPELGDLYLVLRPKAERQRTSHEIALEVRERLARVAVPEGTAIKVVEVPPGPPVLATLLAEIYGPDAETRREYARKVREIFEGIDFVVDVDDSFGTAFDRLRITIDHANLEFHGVEERAVYDTIAALLGPGVVVGYSHRGGGADPAEIVVRVPERARQVTERLLATPVPARGPAGIDVRNVELGDVVAVTREPASLPIFRKDAVPLEMVTGELAGRFEAPIYGMLEVMRRLPLRDDWGPLGPPVIRWYGQPREDAQPTLLWDGEWEITFTTFRDLGGAFVAALLLIYLLIVWQFGNFRVPLAVMLPIPLTFAGILPGHWLWGAHFTATSMIGFIALAGIVVRNSILLADFIRMERAEGRSVEEAVMRAGAIRFKPIALTALAAMAGAAFILMDPIFQGLAVSLVFGLAASTALTLLVIPAVWVLLRGSGPLFRFARRGG
ncbi:Cobalt-zinc-cadmium resistance protein CzcA [bacterium HR40]|nr:Cobalt-zinc-cadmium resistance protein CzcA [bacterium HR40]